MKSRKVLRRLLLVAAILLGLLWASGAMALVPLEDEGGKDPNEVVFSDPISLEEAQAVLEYWTEDRMRAAIPRPMPLVSAEAELACETASPSGPPVFKPSALPDLAAQEELLLEEEGSEDWGGYDQLPGQPEGIEPLGYGYPPPFTRYSVFTTYKRFPYMTIGKVFVTFGGVDYVCSGSAAGRRAVWTAGHCVYDQSDGWATNLAFVPAYKNGSAPYGTWVAFNLGSLVGWTRYGKLCYDIGMPVVSDLGGKMLAQKVGHLGYIANTSRVKHWHSFGYPQASPFNGQKLIVCAASHARNDSPGCTPKTIGIGCDMTGGCSGGPWVYKFRGNPGNTNLVNGVNSYKYTTPNQPRQIYSPYFGKGAVNLYNWGIAW